MCKFEIGKTPTKCTFRNLEKSPVFKVKRLPLNYSAEWPRRREDR